LWVSLPLPRAGEEGGGGDGGGGGGEWGEIFKMLIQESVVIF